MDDTEFILAIADFLVNVLELPVDFLLCEFPIKGCFTIRVHFQKLYSSPVLTVEAYFDFKVLLPKHWSGLGLPTARKRRLESINF